MAGIKSVMCNFAFTGPHSVSIGVCSSIFERDQFYDWIILKELHYLGENHIIMVNSITLVLYVERGKEHTLLAIKLS